MLQECCGRVSGEPKPIPPASFSLYFSSSHACLTHAAIFHPGVKVTYKRSNWQKGLQPWCSGITHQLWNRQAEYFYSQKDNLISYLSCFYWTKAESNHNGYFQIRFSFFSLNRSRIGLSRLILCLCSGPDHFLHTYIPEGLVWPGVSWFFLLCPTLLAFVSCIEGNLSQHHPLKL